MSIRDVLHRDSTYMAEQGCCSVPDIGVHKHSRNDLMTIECSAVGIMGPVDARVARRVIPPGLGQSLLCLLLNLIRVSVERLEFALVWRPKHLSLQQTPLWRASELNVWIVWIAHGAASVSEGKVGDSVMEAVRIYMSVADRPAAHEVANDIGMFDLVNHRADDAFFMGRLRSTWPPVYMRRTS